MLIFKNLNVIITYLFLLLFFFLLANISLSEEINKQSTLFIKADESLEWNRKEQVIFAKGNAKVHNKTMEIQASKIVAKYEGEIKENKFKLISAFEGFWKQKDLIIKGEKIIYNISNQEVNVIGQNVSVSSKVDKIYCSKNINYLQFNNSIEASGDCRVEMKDNKKLAAKKIRASINQNGEILNFFASGSVNLFLDEDLKSISADEAEYNKTTSTIFLEGNIELLVGSSYLNGDKAIINTLNGVAQVFSNKNNNVTGFIKN